MICGPPRSTPRTQVVSILPGVEQHPNTIGAGNDRGLISGPSGGATACGVRRILIVRESEGNSLVSKAYGRLAQSRRSHDGIVELCDNNHLPLPGLPRPAPFLM